MILDLGCGLAKTKGAYGIDNVQLEGVDLVWDLNVTPYPFEAESIDKIILSDVIEHLDDPVKVIKECHRLLKSNCELYIKVVYYLHKYCWGDPQHKHAFSEIYFTHFLKSHVRNYVYDFYFSTLDIKFFYEKEDIIQGMEITLIK